MDKDLISPKTLNFPGSVTATQFSGVQYRSSYFVAVTPSNTFGLGSGATTFFSMYITLKW